MAQLVVRPSHDRRVLSSIFNRLYAYVLVIVSPDKGSAGRVYISCYKMSVYIKIIIIIITLIISL